MVSCIVTREVIYVSLQPKNHECRYKNEFHAEKMHILCGPDRTGPDQTGPSKVSDEDRRSGPNITNGSSGPKRTVRTFPVAIGFVFYSKTKASAFRSERKVLSTSASLRARTGMRARFFELASAIFENTLCCSTNCFLPEKPRKFRKYLTRPFEYPPLPQNL